MSRLALNFVAQVLNLPSSCLSFPGDFEQRPSAARPAQLRSLKTISEVCLALTHHPVCPLFLPTRQRTGWRETPWYTESDRFPHVTKEDPGPPGGAGSCSKTQLWPQAAMPVGCSASQMLQLLRVATPTLGCLGRTVQPLSAATTGINSQVW